MNTLLLKKKIESFLQEDLEFGDLSTQLFSHRSIEGYFIAKQAGIICGLQVINATYQLFDSNIKLSLLVKEGEKVEVGQKIAYVKGDAAVLLSCERVILNLLQHMSGIASHTALMIKKLNDPLIKLVDTRKTTPGLRLFDKYAVRIGGGYNHRLSLSDGIMIKDNHIALANSIIPALQLAHKNAGPLTKIEIEVETLKELKDAIRGRADVIMFDNQTPQTIKKWAHIVPKTIKTEASGGITEKNIAQYKGCGVDFISSGELTNNIHVLDISFLVNNAVKINNQNKLS